MRFNDRLGGRFQKTQYGFLQPLLRIIEVLGAAAAALLVLERFNQEGLMPLLQWIEGSPNIFLANLAILACIYILLRIWFLKPLIPASLFGTFIFAIGGVHYLKVLLKGEPLMPMDIFSYKEASMIAPNMNIQLNRGFWFNLVFLILCIALIYGYQRFIWKPLPVRRWLLVVPAAVLAVLCLASLGSVKIRSRFDVIDIRYDQSTNYIYNGFMVASVMNMSGSRVKIPANYDQAYFQQLLQSTEFNEKATNPEKLPNIIVLQMEAYSDPRLLDPTLQYDPDPFAALDKYKDQMHSFHTMTSVLGGSTATTEFEFLTGFNMAHAPQGIMPFVQYMTKERPSLAWDLQEIGYKTIGVHPNIGSFYSRDTAYPYLGFQQFLTLDDFKDPKYVGYYVSDQSTKDKIIETFENRDKEQPLFCFTVTIQNHGPYNLDGIDLAYGVEDGAVSLNDTQNRELRNYASNLQDESQMLADLLGYFSKQDEPVLLLAYGDHQATWSWSKSLPDSQKLQTAKYLTEGFFWANYSVDFEERPVIGANYLSPYLLKYAGIPQPEYYQLLYRQAEQVLGYNPFFVLNQDHSVTLQPDSNIESFALVQYDRMFGRNYLEALLENGKK